ncbi:MAG: formyl transferase [Nitrospirae bacterium]|nr:formyl transferase [Nitrospirota bacterium]
MNLGLWTTGRDEAAFALLKAIYNATKDSTIKGVISYIFCNRKKGEGIWSDTVINWGKEISIPVVSISSSKYEPELKKIDFEEWRKRFHTEARKHLSSFSEDIRTLVGYMLILDTDSCRDKTTINLHPAKPGGPKGAWQEVIWDLIENNADESGVMIHLVTPELDAGPSVSYCLYKIKNRGLEKLWEEHRMRLKNMRLPEIIKHEGESYPLFNEIRRLGLKREFPLLIHTLKTLSEGKVRVEKGKVMDREGRILREGYNLTKEIDEAIR